MSEKNIYQLKLHESTTLNPYRITRVPGGWLYSQFTKSSVVTDTFVPYFVETGDLSDLSEEEKTNLIKRI